MSSHSSSSSSSSSPSSSSSSWLSWLIVVPVGIASGITLAWLWTRRSQKTQQQLEHAVLTDEEYTRELVRLKDLQLGLPTRESLFFFGPHSHPPQVTLLNHGSFGTVPRLIMDRHVHYMMRCERHTDLWFRRDDWSLTRASLIPLASYIHADPADLVYVNNATSAVNAVLFSLDLHPGDIIITPTLTYNACKLAMQHTAQRTGCVYLEFDIPLPITSHQQILYAIQTCIAQYGSRIKFMLCDIITSPTAIIMPFDEITALCHAHNIFIMLDGAHAIGQVPLDMISTNADWVCMNLHKWLFGCKGSALLWARKDRQEKLHPVVTSHSFRDDYIHRFWMQATRDNACYIASAQGLTFLKALGEERVHAYNMSLSLWAASYLAQTWNTVGQELCPAEMHAYMRVVATPMILPKHLRDGPYPSPSIDSWVHTLMMCIYDEFNVMIAILCYNHRLYVRISTQIYNVKSEYERLAQVIALVAKRQHDAETLVE